MPQYNQVSTSLKTWLTRVECHCEHCICFNFIVRISNNDHAWMMVDLLVTPFLSDDIDISTTNRSSMLTKRLQLIWDILLGVNFGKKLKGWKSNVRLKTGMYWEMRVWNHWIIANIFSVNTPTFWQLILCRKRDFQYIVKAREKFPNLFWLLHYEYLLIDYISSLLFFTKQSHD